MTINLKQVIDAEELIENSLVGHFLHFPTKYEIYEHSIMESLLRPFVARAHFVGSKMGLIIIGWASSGMLIKLKRTVRSPFAGAQTKESNIFPVPLRRENLQYVQSSIFIHHYVYFLEVGYPQ